MASAQRHRVLVVDDEPEILHLMGELLSHDYDVSLAKDGSEAFDLARNTSPSVIVLDVMMPGMDGIQLCEKLRTDVKTRAIPVLMLTAVRDSSDRVRAFRAGADDFISKPVMADELLARVASKVRRIEENGAAPGKVIQCGNLNMNLESLEVTVAERPITLTMLEFDLLRFLVENKGKLCSRQQIMESVWNEPGAAQKGRLLDPHILSLRKKLEGFDHSLSTVYGGGYILKAG